MELKIGKVLTRLFNEKRITLREASAKTGISVSTIAEWTNNRTPRDPVAVRKLADFLGVSLNHLLFAEPDPNPLEKILKEELFSGTFEISLKRVQLGKEKGK